MQHYSTYAMEKMMEFRQADINKRLKRRWLIIQAVQEGSEEEAQVMHKRRFWQIWFGKKRLHTSMK